MFDSSHRAHSESVLLWLWQKEHCGRECKDSLGVGGWYLARVEYLECVGREELLLLVVLRRKVWLTACRNLLVEAQWWEIMERYWKCMLSVLILHTIFGPFHYSSHFIFPVSQSLSGNSSGHKKEVNIILRELQPKYAMRGRTEQKSQERGKRKMRGNNK